MADEEAKFLQDGLEWYLANRIVRTPGGSVYLDDGGAKYFRPRIVARDRVAGISEIGDPIPVVDLEPVPNAVGPGNGVFAAYWCPFVLGKMRRTVVGRDAPLMFTAPMDGCSFGVGMPNGDGFCIVGHVNRQLGTGSSSDNYAKQGRDLARSGLTAGVLSAEDYMPGPTALHNVHVTAAGERDSVTGKWSFHYQVCDVILGAIRTYRIRRVEQFV